VLGLDDNANCHVVRVLASLTERSLRAAAKSLAKEFTNRLNTLVPGNHQDADASDTRLVRGHVVFWPPGWAIAPRLDAVETPPSFFDP
jgi:hypothetical protein